MTFMKTRNPLLSYENVTHLAKFPKLNVLIQHQAPAIKLEPFFISLGSWKERDFTVSVTNDRGGLE